jgi:hypothetical protein
MRLGAYWVLVSVVALLFASCNDPLFIGTDLLKQDQVGLGYTDTTTLYTTTIKQDTFLVYDPSVKILDGFLVGKYKDQHFGTATASIYLQYRLGNLNIPDFSGAKFDSLILGLVYDTVRVYGDYKKETQLNVYRLSEPMTATLSYQSDKTFASDPISIGSKTFIPDPTKKIQFTDYPGSVRDTILSNQLRIKLDDAIGQELMTAPDSIFKTNDNFLSRFKGIKISASTENAGMLAFNPLDLNSKITLYYSKNDTSYQYEFIVSSLSARTVSFEQDYTGTIVNNYLNSGNKSDSLAFLQGMAGTIVKLQMPNIKSLDGKIVNKAELEFYVREFDNDDPAFKPVSNILLAEKNSSGKYVSISDVIIAVSNGAEAGLNKYFGGTVVEESVNGVKLLKYKMNVSAHLQKMIQGKSDDSIYLTVYRRPESANRVALYGTGSIRPPKLKITYTDSIL